jgi:hypothetical protein
MFRLLLQVKLLRLLPVVTVALLGAGCASAVKSAALSSPINGWYSVVSEKTPFYHYGPQQGNGPDSQLSKDAIMKVIRPSFGYVKVQLQDGEDGYVASEDIRPAPATLVAEKLAPPKPPPIVASQGEQFGLDSNDPRLIAPPEPLPEASPTPTFRY